MIGVILDTKHIENLMKDLSKQSTTYNLIFLVLDDQDFFTLEHSKNKKKLLNTVSFLQKIIYYTLANYVASTNTVYLTPCDDNYVELLFKTFNIYFEDTLTIVAPYSESFASNGFVTPASCQRQSQRQSQSHSQSQCVSRLNNFVPSSKSPKYDIAYLKSQQDKKYCNITIELDKDSIEYLNYISTAGVKDGEQKEVFGTFNIIHTKMSEGDVVHVLKLDMKSIIYGDDDQIHAPPSLYNFHSHPFQAYLKYKVNYGVPSVSDYIAVYTMSRYHNSIVHFVASLEGLYTLSVNPESKLFTLDKKHVEDFITYNMRYEKNIKHINDYLSHINKFGLFEVNLIPWEKLEGKSIRIKFNKVDKQCVIR